MNARNAGLYASEAWFACGGVEDEACFAWLLGDLTGRMLDVGCSGGGACAYMAARGGAVVGVDALPAALSRARQACPGGEFLLADALALPFASGSFDGAHLGCMAPVLGANYAAAIAELHRVLRPGGRLLLGDMGPARTLAGFTLLRQKDASAALRSFAARWIWNDGGPLPFCGGEKTYTLAVYERRE